MNHQHPIKFAKTLRNNQTPAEQALWYKLRSRQINGRKWRRQQPIDKYIVDFYCSELQIVIELDGDVHVFQEKEDKERQEYLESLGLHILRFTNNDVFNNLEGVLATIWEITK